MDWQEILKTLEEGKKVDWNQYARRQRVELLAIGQQYAEESQARSVNADRVMQELIENAKPDSRPEQHE